MDVAELHTRQSGAVARAMTGGERDNYFRIRKTMLGVWKQYINSGLDPYESPTVALMTFGLTGSYELMEYYEKLQERIAKNVGNLMLVRNIDTVDPSQVHTTIVKLGAGALIGRLQDDYSGTIAVPANTIVTWSTSDPHVYTYPEGEVELGRIKGINPYIGLRHKYGCSPDDPITFDVSQPERILFGDIPAKLRQAPEYARDMLRPYIEQQVNDNLVRDSEYAAGRYTST